MEKILVMGAGHQGLAMAAHLSLNGVDCYLWNRTAANIEKIKRTRTITCKGCIEGEAKIHAVSDRLEGLLQKTIMIAAPSSAHRDIAKLLAYYVDDSYTIILNPGRTFGVVDFMNELKKNGCKSIPCIAETQTIIYTCRRAEEDSVWIYALKQGVYIAGINDADTARAYLKLPSCLQPYFKKAESYIQTSFGNVGMILHCAPVLMNIGWIESHKSVFKYYYDGISPSIANILEKLDLERTNIANILGYPVESLSEWLNRVYQASGINLYEQLQNNKYYRNIDAPQSINHRYIEEDIPNGLVPLEAAGRSIGIATPVASLIIDLANAVMEHDYRSSGRGFTLINNYHIN